MKKALLYFDLVKNGEQIPQTVFIYNDGEVKIVGNELTMGGSMQATSLRNTFAALTAKESEDAARMIFDEYTPAAPGYTAQSFVVDYEGEGKEMADDMFNKLSSRNFDNAKRKKDG